MDTHGQYSLEFTPMYFDKYVVSGLDWGFIWLDTQALTGGSVQVMGSCGIPNNPAPTSNLWTVADCQALGTPGLSSDGNTLVMNNLGNGCHVLAIGSCSGPLQKQVQAFGYQVGTWRYTGLTAQVPAGTSQTTDPQGRTWSVACTPVSSDVICTWTASGNPNAPPSNNATATNNSAASRADKTNYFGDQWTLTDTSASIRPVTTTQWDFVYSGAFAADLSETPTVTAPPWETHSFPFPCDPSSGGNIAAGTGCWASVGSPTTTGPYQFALQDTNVNGVGTPLFVSSSISVSPPQISINGTTNPANPTLVVLTGGAADASGTQGNTGSATFAWTFSPGGNFSGPLVASVPASAITYSLTVTYPGGYATTLSGSVQQVDLVPSFTLTPNPVLVGPPPGQITLTNKMQKSSSAVLNSVDYATVAGACGSAPSTWDGNFINTNPFVSQLPNGGTAQVTGPSTEGSYCMWLRYNFTNSSGSQSLAASAPFSATTWAPRPSPIAYRDTAGTQLACNFIPCDLITNTTYYLFDIESLPNGITHPGTSWKYNGNAIGTTSGAGPLTWTSPGTTCSTSCTLQVDVPGEVSAGTLAITLSNPAPPPPNPPTVSISGPTSLNIGQAGTFSANVSNAVGAVSYSWLFDDTPFPQSGPASMAHSWSANGTHSVFVTVSASNGSANANRSVSVIGNPVPGGGLTLTPSQQSGSTYTVGRGQTITFTATEINALQYGWVFGDGTFAGGGSSVRSVPKAYSAFGTYSASLQVYGDGAHTTGLTTTNFTVVVAVPLPSTAFTVSGATLNTSTGRYDTEVGRTMVFTATEPNASSYSWDFGDGSTGQGKTVVKSYTASGLATVRLTVTGDGVNTNGTNSGTSVFNLAPSTFRAAIVPGVAHLDDGTTTWNTDFSVTNAGSGPMNINLAFVPLLADAFAPSTLDLTQLTYGTPIALAAGGSYSVSDVVTALGGGNNKGTLVIRYTGGSQAPLVTTRVYFQPKSNPDNISYGSSLPAYQVDSAGRISPQGFVSLALQGAQTSGASEGGIEALQDFALTVNLAGTGTGTVTSNPVGITCPPTCSVAFPVGASVELHGSAASGSAFVDFTSGCDLPNLGNCVMTMNAAKTVTATFTATGTNYTLSVSQSGTGTGTITSSPGGISCGSTCSASFSSGTTVTLTETPDSGFNFGGWGGACSGTGSCSVTLTADTSVTASFTTGPPPPPPPSPDQLLIGLRSDPRYRFGVTLFNASGASGTFRLSATDEESSPILISDGSPTPVAYRDFAIRPYQQIYLRNDDLGLNDSNKRYVLKAIRTSAAGTLLAFGTALDKKTNDFLQVTDDSQASTAEAGIISYWVAGVSRYDSSYGAHWRTDLRIYNRGSHARNLYFEYQFSKDGFTEHVARVSQKTIAAGELLTYDDVIGSLLVQDTSADLSGSTAGVLRIFYAEDLESSTRPLVIGSRNYDDQPTGTAGSQLAVYTHVQSAGPGQKLVLTGAEESARYASRIGVFALDPGPATGVISAIGPDGSVVGSTAFTIGGAGPHYGQLSLTNFSSFVNPGKPVSIRIDQISGGRVAAYAFTVDKVTLDTNFIQALPQ